DAYMMERYIEKEGILISITYQLIGKKENLKIDLPESIKTIAVSEVIPLAISRIKKQRRKLIQSPHYQIHIKKHPFSSTSSHNQQHNNGKE
ncbi:MAG TPA: hypothetical protein VFF27_10955, partial [Bacteroidia bacterium]|nr:hypothetical protein [Bacteroidia bacterium]